MTKPRLTQAGKRVVDIVVCLLALPVAVPVVLLAAWAIRREDGAAAIFRQQRVGRGERVFLLYKLRTMRLDTGDLPSHEAPRSTITRIGAVLRRTKIDELPQLLNVLRGEMSLVGPRPCLPSQTCLIAERRRRGVFDVRPGITGLAQVEGLTMAHPVELAARDEAYVSQHSLWRDFAILGRTLLGSGGGDAVS